jgi:hypothetical protein
LLGKAQKDEALAAAAFMGKPGGSNVGVGADNRTFDAFYQDALRQTGGDPIKATFMARQAVDAQKATAAGSKAGAETTGRYSGPALQARIESMSKLTGVKTQAAFEATLDQPITRAEAIAYQLPAGTTRKQLLSINPVPISESDKDAATQFAAAQAMMQEYRSIVPALLTATDAMSSIGQRIGMEYGVFTRTNADAVRLKALQATLPLLVRALGEKGTLATQDVERAAAAVPDFADTQETAQAKLKQLDQFMAKVQARIQNVRPGIATQRTEVAPSQPASQGARPFYNVRKVQ